MQHKNITGADVHVSHAWAYADATARTAATGFAATDVGKIAHQQADNTFWFLADHDPITWSQSGGAGMVAAEHTHAIDDVTGLQTALDGKADTGHNHDAAYAALGHDHDDRYFTEAEVTTALSGKSDTTHNHDADYAALGHSHALNDLSDVSTAGATDGQVLTAQADGSFAFETPTSGGATTLDGLSDVVITTPASGQVLKYNGTNWVNDTDSTGGGSSNPTASVRQTVLSARVDSNGFPNFLSAGSGLAVNVAATTTPIVTTYAAGFDTASPYGPVDYFDRVTADTTIGSLTASSTCYLYREYGVGFGHVTITPVYSAVAPTTTGNISPTLTSNTAPSPYVASATSSLDSRYLPYKAFTHTNSGEQDTWLSGAQPTSGAPQEIVIDLGSGNDVSVLGHAIQNRDWSDLTTAPKSWTFEGSNDGSSWTVLDTQTNAAAWTQAERRVYSISPTASYRYFKLRFTDNHGSGNYVGVGEFELLGGLSSSAVAPWFDLSTMKMKRWNGTAWETKQRVFLGEAVTNGSGVTSVVTYALNGKYDSGRFTIASTTAYTKSHNLGVAPLIVDCRVAVATNGDLYPATYYNSAGNQGTIGGAVNRLTVGLIAYSRTTLTGTASSATAVEARITVARGW